MEALHINRIVQNVVRLLVFVDIDTPSSDAQEYLQQTHKRPLEEAEMALTNFMGSRGDIIFLTEAHSKSMTALTDGNSLDIQLGAAVIAIAADYIKRSAVSVLFAHGFARPARNAFGPLIHHTYVCSSV